MLRKEAKDLEGVGFQKFLIVDEKLYQVAQKEISLGNEGLLHLPPLLDAFHLQWNIVKTVMSVFDEAGLRQLFVAVGYFDEKEYTFIKEAKNVHRAQYCLEELWFNLQIEMIHLFVTEENLCPLDLQCLLADLDKFYRKFEGWQTR
jgi:hypothetical protein